MASNAGKVEELRGVILAVAAIDREGEIGYPERFSIDLEDDTLDVRRLGARGDTVWSIKLADVEEALRTLKRWQRSL